jgi:lipoprotein signal peptidase
MSSDTTAPATGTSRWAWRRLVFVALLVALDLWTKSATFEWLARLPGEAPPVGVEVWARNGHWRFPVIGEFLGFMLSENKGAAWGMGHDMPYLLVGGRVVAVFVLTYLALRTEASQRLLCGAFVLVLAGAIGNLYDNLVRTPPEGHPFGAVRDFIHVYFERWDYHFPTFNVADSCITVGAALLILSSFTADKKSASDRSAEDMQVRQNVAPDASEGAARS